jgi:hypothetical protein
VRPEGRPPSPGAGPAPSPQVASEAASPRAGTGSLAAEAADDQGKGEVDSEQTAGGGGGRRGGYEGWLGMLVELLQVRAMAPWLDGCCCSLSSPLSSPRHSSCGVQGRLGSVQFEDECSRLLGSNCFKVRPVYRGA